jgi:alkylated DNA repair dioxygenase AlkB
MFNTQTLFPEDEHLVRPDILVQPDFLALAESEKLLQWCLANVPWRNMALNFKGQTVPVPRELAWFGDVDYAYSGIRHPAAPMPQPLRELADKISAWCALQGRPAQFNSLLLNHYRDGNDSIGMHSDDETQLGSRPLIASISLGATCTFKFEHKQTRQKLAEPLHGGTLLVMAGDTQEQWRHGIPKEPGRGPRVNLTYRYTFSDVV